MKSPENNPDLGRFVHERRLSRGLDIDEAARRSGLHPSYWRKLEAGHYHAPAPKHLRRIADVIDAELEDLYALAGHEIPERLPSFQPYLRAKYQLPPRAVAELERYFDLLRNYYDIPKDQPVFPPKPETLDDPERATPSENPKQNRRAA